MVIAIYCRKSVYRDTSDSIKNQIDMCKDFIKRCYGDGHTILVYDQDEGISGATIDRPCFQKMMSDIENDIIDMVVCYMIDRISRNIKDFCNIYFMLQEHNCRFVSVKENIDDTTAMGRAMLYICQVFANLERDNIRERVIDNMNHIERAGYWSSGLPPLGYKIAKIIEHGKKHTVLEIDEENCGIYLHLVDLFLNQRKTLFACEKELRLEGVHTRKGAVIDSSRIWKILSNPAYMCADKTAYNYFKSAGCNIEHDISLFDGHHAIMVRGRFKKEGSKTVLKDKKEWKVYVGIHKPLISSSDWIKMQDFFKGNVYSKKKKTDKFGICSGVIRCKCGYSMRSKHDKRCSGYTIYTCTRKENKLRGTCDSKNVKCEVVDNAVIDMLRQISTDRDTLAKFVKKDNPKPVYNTKSLKRRLSAIDKQIQKFTLSLLDAEGTAAKKYIIQEIDKLDLEKTDINSKLTESSIIDLRAVKEDKHIDELYENIHSLLKEFDTLDTFSKNNMIKFIIKEVVVDGNNITLKL